MMPDTSLHTGGCRCGAVRFTASAAPHHVSYCHCGDCRRASGAPVSAFVGFKSVDVAFSGAEPSRFSTGMVTRTFCGTCGSPLTYTDARLQDDLYFVIGAMDEPQSYTPTVHAYVSEKLPYLPTDDGLPHLARTSVPRPDGSKL